jgi:hypothetical protein
MLFHIRRPLAVLSCFWLIAGLGLPTAQPQTPSSPFKETRRSETLAPGIEHEEILREARAPGASTDRWIIHVLVLDPRRARLTVARAMDELVGTEPTSSLAARHGALAAVNGGYFRTTGIYRGEPAGMLAFGDRVLSEPSGPRAELAISNAGGRTRIAVAQIDVGTTVTVDGGTPRQVDGINRPRGPDELILFTPEFHRTTLTGPDGVEAVVQKGIIIAVHDGAGSGAVPADGCILSAAGTAGGWGRDHFRVGARLEFRTDVKADPPLPFAPDFIIGGGPHLIKNGRPLGAAEAAAEKFNEDFILKRHPRTAIGKRSDGRLMIITVDGRQPQKSAGMTIDELTSLMVGLGCVEAINLDGGGSTTMAVKGKTVNNPSDPAGERPVSDALLIFRR